MNPRTVNGLTAIELTALEIMRNNHCGVNVGGSMTLCDSPAVPENRRRSQCYCRDEAIDQLARKENEHGRAARRQ